jgi:toxin ParE1/3/4
MSRYVLTPEAAADLREIRDYVLEQGSPRAARYVVGAIISACRSVALTPGQGHRRPDLTSRNELRFRSVFSYLIVYRLGKKPVHVIAILHGKRDVAALLSVRT